MNMQVSRRQFIKLTGAGIAGSAIGSFGFGGFGRGGGASRTPLQARTHDRDPQHLPLLLGQLRRHHVFARRQGEEREVRDHPHRGRSRTTRSIAARCARRARRCSTSSRSKTRLKHPDVPRSRAPTSSSASPGTTPGAHRAPDEGRPRRQLQSKNKDGADRQPLADHRLPGRLSATTNETG